MFAAMSSRIRTPLHSFASFSYRFSASGTPFLRIVLDRTRDERGGFARPLTYRCETSSSSFSFLFFFFLETIERRKSIDPRQRLEVISSLFFYVLAYSCVSISRENPLFLRAKKKRNLLVSRVSSLFCLSLSLFHLFKFAFRARERLERVCGEGRQ